MFPFRHSTIFRSRWMALLWAAGFCWMAVDVATAHNEAANETGGDNASIEQQDASGETYTEKDLKGLGKTLEAF